MSRLLRTVLVLVAVAIPMLGCGRGAPEATPAAPPAADGPSVVETASGRVHGAVDDKVRFFGGIPYAAPPVGPLRWQAPQPVPSWPTTREATAPGPHCLQDLGAPVEIGKQADEDCLSLNVWTPPVSDEKKPVLVYIHGGSFISGSGDVYDSRWMVERGDIVVVTINYRLGTPGFLAHPSLGPSGDVGNYGLLDQQAALRWVRDNIANFGGDPDKVTIAGESAGGMSVCDHLVAPGSAGLFRAAILQSAPCQAQVALAEAERISVDWANARGCGDPATAADCLRALPADKLRDPVRYYRISDGLSGPVTGTAALPVDPMTAIAQGDAAKVPVLIGSNHDEFTLFVGFQTLANGREYTAAEYPGLLEKTFGANAQAVGERYPLDRYGGSTSLAYSAAVTDGAFACVTERMSDELANVGPVYAYEFNDPAPPTPDPLRTLPFPVGASHALELRYLFDVGGAPPLTPEQKVLSNQMIDYWAQFVKTGAPDVADAPAWPRLDPAQGSLLSLQPDGNRVMTDFDANHQCGFWAGLEN